MHYYAFNIGDYTSHTAHLSPIEDIAYRRLLDLYYQTESPISTDLKSVCRQIRMRDHESDVQLILTEFFTLSDAGWGSSRCDKEILSFKSKADKARSNGKLGGRPKNQDGSYKEPRNNQSGFSSFHLANPDETQSKPTEKLTNKHKPITKKQETRTIDSVPKGTGGQAAKMTDPAEIIFGYGLSMMVNAGTSEKQGRSFLGGLRKAHGDVELIDKLRACAKARPLQPLEWLAAALPPPMLKGSGDRNLNKQEALEARNRAVGDEWVAEMMAKAAEEEKTYAGQ